MYLLDTCVISELVKLRPSSKVIQWIGSQPESDLFMSVLTAGDIEEGIAALASGANLVPAIESLRISITVTGPGGVSTTLEGYRTRYAPRTLP